MSLSARLGRLEQTWARQNPPGWRTWYEEAGFLTCDATGERVDAATFEAGPTDTILRNLPLGSPACPQGGHELCRLVDGGWFCRSYSGVDMRA